jgi:membrane-associated phospholipid phosphatase
VCLLVPCVAAAQEPAGPAADQARPNPEGRRTIGRLPANLIAGVTRVFRRDNLAPLLIGSAATSLGHLADDEVADVLADPAHPFGRVFENATQPVLLGAVAAGVLAISRRTTAPRFRAVSYDLVAAFAVNEFYTTVLKEAVGRERPNGEDRLSFPSGHSSSAFAMATVADRHFGWKAGLTAYAAASLVAVSRLQRDKHHLSDVLAGATLGYVVGRTVVSNHSRPVRAHAGPVVTISPVVTARQRRVAVNLVY